MNPIVGSIVALVTPMHEDGSVDYDGLRALIDWHIAEGTDCIGVVGTTGESPTVTVDEHCEIIKVAVQHSAGRVPIMAGCGANATAEAIELSRYAKDLARPAWADLASDAAACSVDRAAVDAMAAVIAPLRGLRVFHYTARLAEFD